MHEFVPGQRWINDAELQLGLGTVLAVEHRTVQIVFLASGETRVYAKKGTPLTRVRFAAGDELRCEDGQMLTVDDVLESDGLLVYYGQLENGERLELPETMLDNFMQLNKPQERMFTGQIDANKWFDVRYQSWLARHKNASSPMQGLTGARTSLIPHQLYIAHEVSRRFEPRVLLADEVGLGKTIEAGLILHQQLLTERAQRALIVVPGALLHQWLVEMLRKFNLHFSIFDAERYQAAWPEPAEGDTDLDAELDEFSMDAINPFMDEQLVLCSMEFLSQHQQAAQSALEAEWDLLIVDEAHHLQWSEEQASEEYLYIEKLAQRTRGVLLLTATPEQLGKESHFARLRLLDPDRFSDFATFIEEEASYGPIAGALNLLTDESSPAAPLQNTLRALLEDEDELALIDQLGGSENQNARQALMDKLLDRHGTGRVLFRNTRAAISGFPERTLHAYPMEMPEEYSKPRIASQPNPECRYRDETMGEDWVNFDTRIDWLQGMIRDLRREKILLITHSAETALDIAEVLRVRDGLQAAVFHEGMSIVERDRSAAFFADLDYGCQILICSEIGSEGRNFQFAHHLLMFDLPANPDLLEQRIGRLDRIGQTETIQIHVPYFRNSAQEVLYHWYHDGLQAFEQLCPAAHIVYRELKSKVNDVLEDSGNVAARESLIAETRSLTDTFNERLHSGRDRLLEYNSCRPHVAAQLARSAEESDEESTLAQYMENVFDCFGVHSEPHSDDALIIRPAENMFAPFPHLADEGMTVSYDRGTALANEDMHFLTWDHRMVGAALEMITGAEKGNCSAIAVKAGGLKAGSMMLECIFVLECPQASSRYLPPSTIRTLLDEKGRPLHGAVSYELLQAAAQPLDRKTSVKVVKARTEVLEGLIRSSKILADQEGKKLAATAHQQASTLLEGEIVRLEALQRHNPNVRDAEVDAFKQELATVNHMIAASGVRLDALRIVVAL